MFLREPLPLLRWGMLVGEIVHDLRCALDYLTWELTLRHQRRIKVSPRTSPKQRWTAVQFPVSERRADWIREARNRLWGIDPSVWTRFEKFQPHQLKRSYQRHALWVLNRLWNTDKHRTVTIIVAYTNLTDIILAPAENHALSATLVQNLALETLSATSTGPFKNGAEIARVVLHHGDLMLRGTPLRNVPVQVNPEVRFEPRFQQAGPGHGEPVVQTLALLVAFVQSVLRDFDVEFR
jgi:hypothetical protein